MWLLMASAFADGGHMASYADAETSFSALERYRRRPALYDLGTASAIRREQRWGIGLGLEEQGLPSSPADAAPDPPREHRSGVGGVPFYNLAEVLDEQTLGREVMGALRRSWWGGDGSTSPFVPRLAAALEASAHPSTRDVLLTFANSGYLDFVLNGFPRSVVPHTLVVALDAHAQRALEAAGHTAYFEPRLPPIQVGQQMQGSHAFMDIMKLRLLCAAEALVLGYNVLLTDADAVFMKPPWAALEAAAALSVACDATVVPRSWRLAPGMVMAGFWYAKGLDPAAIGSAASASTNSTATDSPAPPALPASSSLFPSSGSSRPIIFLLEVLEYQAHHPSQHDQQAFNQILSELLTADMRVAVLHPRLFPNGFQYFVRRSAQRDGLKPVVVQNNWMMGADNKRHRFREAHLWSVDPPWCAIAPRTPIALVCFQLARAASAPAAPLGRCRPQCGPGSVVCPRSAHHVSSLSRSSPIAHPAKPPLRFCGHSYRSPHPRVCPGPARAAYMMARPLRCPLRVRSSRSSPPSGITRGAPARRYACSRTTAGRGPSLGCGTRHRGCGPRSASGRCSTAPSSCPSSASSCRARGWCRRRRSRTATQAAGWIRMCWMTTWTATGALQVNGRKAGQRHRNEYRPYGARAGVRAVGARCGWGKGRG